jgi:hypothetical protein
MPTGLNVPEGEALLPVVSANLTSESPTIRSSRLWSKCRVIGIVMVPVRGSKVPTPPAVFVTVMVSGPIGVAKGPMVIGAKDRARRWLGRRGKTV